MPPVISLASLQSLYDQNKFLQAFQQTAEYWQPSTPLTQFSSDELVLAARLAARLGGPRLCRWLSRAAFLKNPIDGRVLYYSWHFRRRNIPLFDELRAWESAPELPNADPDVQSSWLASQATVWASVREFARARQSIDRAHAIHPRDSWVFCCESAVLGMEDRWQEALAAAEAGWEIRPGTPYGASSLGQCLLNLRQVREAALRLSTLAETTESYENAQLACWYLCALAESEPGDERRRLLGRARELSERVPQLAPLADSETRPHFARARLDVAEQEDDHEAMARWAAEADSPFHKTVLKNLRNNPQGQRIRLPFRRAIQRHEECLPTSISSALGAMGIPVEPEAIASQLTFGGTPEWAAAEWLAKRDIAVRFFLVTPETASTLIRNGIAFVVSLESDANAHAVAAVGLDEAAGTLIIHDPQGLRATEYLLEYFGKGEAPLGPKGMAMVPQEKAALLDQLLPAADVQAMTATEAHQRAILQQGPAAARAVLTNLQKAQPNHPITRLLQALQDLEEGRVGVALTAFQQLFQEFPNSAFVRARILSACRSLGNTALMRSTLAGVVERGVLPGVQSQQDWVRPPGAYTSEYAALLGASADGSARARSLLNSVISREPSCAQAWHALGDLLWQEENQQGASLAYRIASALAANNEHYARACCDALANIGRKEEGLEWLAQRVRRFGRTTFGGVTWVTWIGALEDWGHPERALAASEDALGVNPASEDLLAFVVPFSARMGQWERAEALLQRLAKGTHPALYHQAAVEFYRMRGELDSAIEHAEAWVRDAPNWMRTRSELLHLLAKRDSARSALQRSAQWLAEFPGHDDLENLHGQILDKLPSVTGRKYALYRRRVRRNPEDAWAWRELGFLSIAEFTHAAGKRQERMRRRVIAFIAQADRTAPEHPATLRLHAEWHEAQGQWQTALGGWLASLARDPGSVYGYQRVMELLARCDAQQRQAAWRRVAGLLPTSPGRLSAARDIAARAGQQLSVETAEQSLAAWKKLRPDDPELIEATADLLLDHGHGRTDAQRALEMLEPAVSHFPYHMGLRFSLGNALRELGKISQAEDVLAEIARRQPENTAAELQLTRAHQRNGRLDRALQVLDGAARRDPQNAEVPVTRAQILRGAGRVQDALAVLASGMPRFSESVYWRESAVRLYAECGDAESAVRVAREGVRVFPRGAYLWFLLGRALHQHKAFAAPGEVESCLRRSLTLNQELYASADHLAMHLVDQRRYSDAEEVMVQIRDRLSDPSPARGRLAWIHREAGKKDEARREMATLVGEVPWYAWGWGVLMEWLAEDKARDETLRLLAVTPRELATNAQFRRRRLMTLAQAAASTSEQDTEWVQLLRDFPEDVSLHLYRYDSLRDANRLPEAEAVLRQILPVDPDSPYVLARLVEVLARDQNKRDDATKAILKIFFASAEPSNWPAEFAWSAVKKAHFQEAVYQKAKEAMQRGALPTVTSIALLAAHPIAYHGTAKRALQPLWRSWFPDPGAKEVLVLLKLVDAAPKATGAHRANVLAAFTDSGYRRLVVSYWKKHRAAVEQDVETWAETGRVLVAMRRMSPARALLADWRGRVGVPMWLIANYLMSLSGTGKKQLREALSTCRDALAGLPHDHTAKYVAHRHAEAALLLGDQPAFLEVWKSYRGYFDGKVVKPDWFEDQRKHLLSDVPSVGRALDASDPREFRRVRRSLFWKRWFATPKFRVGNTNLNLRWWWIVVWILVMLSRVLLHQ